MKKLQKYNLFKVIAITIFVVWLLTLIIPGSYVDYSGNITTNNISGIGIWALLSNLSISISYFNGIAVFVVSIAVFYAVLNKLDVYQRFVKKTALKFNGKENLLVIISIITFGVLAALVSDFMILLALVPFVYQVMKEKNIDVKTILASTIVPGMIGSMCGIYNATLFSTLSLSVNTLLGVKLIMLVISLFILIMFVTPKHDKNIKATAKKAIEKKTEKISETKKTVKNKTKDEKVNKVVYAVLSLFLGTIGINKFYAGKIKSGILCILFSWTLIPTILGIAEFITVLTEKADKNGNISVNSNKLSNVRFGVLLILFTLFFIGSIIPWESLFPKLTIFTDFNAWLNDVKIGEYKIFGNIIGNPVVADAATGASSGIINVFGSWTMTDSAILLFILSGVIGLSSNISFDEFIATTTDGIKKVLPVAVTAMLISIVLVISITSGINVTITNWILSLTKDFNIATSSLAAMIGSVITGDFYYFVSSIGSVFMANITNVNYYGIIGLIMGSLFNLMMIIAPTSVGLIIGLYYLNIPYNKWIKYIWKAFLTLLVLVIIIAVVTFVLI